jgi:hypothetical protein
MTKTGLPCRRADHFPDEKDIAGFSFVVLIRVIGIAPIIGVHRTAMRAEHALGRTCRAG